MSTKPSLLAFLLCFQAVFCFSINRYQVGDTLFVWATSGLTLRAEADFDGKKLEVVPFGSSMICQGEKFGESDQTIEAVRPFHIGEMYEKSPALKLRGQFLKVKFQGREGFLFDAYLGAFPTPKIANWLEYGDKSKVPEFEPMADWLASNFGLVSKNVKELPFDGYRTTIIIYGNGIIEKHDGSMKGGTSSIIYPSLSLEEGYLIYNVFNGHESEVKRSLANPDPMYDGLTFSFSEDCFSFFKRACTFSIKFLKEVGMVIFTSECSC